MMEMELEPRVKPLGYKVKAMSRESPAQKAVNVLDPDLRTHWSTATNNKEWILLELDEPCLLSHLRIYNKSVLEWEITVGLRYKPDTFVKIRPRCEAPRRDMIYPMNYMPCRYVRISCLRGNPIAIYFIQLVGVSVIGLEPEFQPIVNYLLPNIISHKQEAHDMYLQLLQDVTKHLLVFLPQLEGDLSNFADAPESNILFFAMLAGPFYPILHLVNERKSARSLLSSSDQDAAKSNPSSPLTISSNFEAQPRRVRSPLPFGESSFSSIVFRSDAVIMLLRKAYKDHHLGIVCRRASRVLHMLVEPSTTLEESLHSNDLNNQITDEIEIINPVHIGDYSSLFGEEFTLLDGQWDASYLNVLDVVAAEESILHFLYGCAAQPLLCCKLAESNADFWFLLPLMQALLPALRPPLTSPPDQVDDTFWQWKHPSGQHAIYQIVTMSSSPVYRPLLHACAGYLSSPLSSHAKGACVLIDLCSGPLAPWIPAVIAKVDLVIELVEDLLGVIQDARRCFGRARAALKYILLALSGHVDDVLAVYKEIKHRLLFLLELLEPFLDPAITARKDMISFGDNSTTYSAKQERTCAVALNIIRTALQKPAILPSLESEWRRGSVAPSVILSVLGPHVPLPPEVDLCKCSESKIIDAAESLGVNTPNPQGSTASFPNEADAKIDIPEGSAQKDVLDDSHLLFAPTELKNSLLLNSSTYSMREGSRSEADYEISEGKHVGQSNSFQPNNGFSIDYIYMHADYLQLVDHQDSDIRASEFKRLAADLRSQPNITPDGHNAAIDTLLLAAECYTNPFFMLSFKTNSKFASQINAIESKLTEINGLLELNKDHQKYNNLETIAHLERKRDKDVLQILLHAAKMDLDFQMGTSNNETYANVLEDNEQVLELFPLDVDSADAVTLVRKDQTLLCHFVTRQLSRGQQSSHEILLQTLLFLLHSATELSCSPDDVIDIILESAENLDGQIAFLYSELKAQNMQCNLENLHGVQRRWKILQKLVMAASGNDNGGDNIGNTLDHFRYTSLIPHSSWMHKISKFANSPCPLARFLGWMAVSRYAKDYVKERLFLASDLSELALLLSIFADELTLTDNVLKNKNGDAKSEPSYTKSDLQVGKEVELSHHTNSQKSFHVLYPYLHMFFPSMKKQFVAFGEIILEAVGLQLKCLPYDAVPDVLHWLADLCLWPYRETLKDHISVSNTAGSLKGYTARNAKAVVLYVLESVVVGHMEAMIPELPRIAQILTSLCRASYCDVDFLDSVLSILDPLLSYCISKSTDAENMFTEFSLCHGFELSFFEEIFDGIRHRKGSDGTTGENEFVGSLLIFFLAYLFPNLSFRRKKEILESITLWVEFTTSEPTSSFYDYLTALQKFMDSCQTILVQALSTFGVEFPYEKKQGDCNLNIVDSPDLSGRSFMVLSQKQFEDRETDDGLVNQWIHNLPVDEIKGFLDTLVNLVSKLIPAVEASWTLHHKLARNLVFASSECLLFSRCLSLVIPVSDLSGDADGGNINQSNSEALSSTCWSTALQGVISATHASQKNHCWQVSSSMVEYLLTLPESISFDSAVSTLCLVIKNFCQYAPRISWRLLAGKWLSSLLARGILKIDVSVNPLVDLFCAMLGHSEPEQRSVAVQHLGTVVGLENYGAASQSCIINQKLECSGSVVSIPESIVSVVVTKTWDRVTTIAFSDPSMVLRTHATALLLGYIPYAERSQLQAFLAATSTYLRGVGKGTYSIEEGHLTRLSLHLLGSACLYASAEDIMLVPESVWRNVENMAISRTTLISDTERKLCVALRKVRTESDNAKVALKEVMSSAPTAKPSDPSVQSIRESILQVLASLTTVQSYFDFFSKRSDQQSQELEEAEIEMELLNKEKAAQEVSGVPFQEPLKSIAVPHDGKDNSRLQQIKDDIRSIERSKIREEVIVRRQKRLLMRHARQKYLEETALHEMELLQELDRERANELERDIERQRELQLERAKTRDLQLNLDMEKERMRQKELQRELEQIESGVRAPRREISSNPSSRARERYRERENGRSGQEGTLRSSSRDHDGVSFQVPADDTRGSSPVPTVVLSGSRSFSGQLPTILQSRERTDDHSISYEDSFEGSRDSGDTNSIGDPELASAFDGLPGSFGSGSRHGPRGSKSRQIVERRDREARREGKWERKHS